MNKRQKKKDQKKYLPIYADEYNLSTMTIEEREQAYRDYLIFRERYARTTHKGLKEGKRLHYVFPPGKTYTTALQDISSIARKTSNKPLVVHQNIDDFIK
ncbi:hypothetical protein QTG56_24020 (plasmid) [Rossellomorea sp. AcN35-11]|nr:hypothetical protein [Rossellomorea aquimaris]WJV31706.1 hypothetical protein QTG56_24020 [Rossellomorea sp. AcN35-11]